MSPSRVTLTYKFFWFLALLGLTEERAMKGLTVDFSALDVMVRMVSLAWYPLSFRLSFGHRDSLREIVGRVGEHVLLTGMETPDEVEAAIRARIGSDPKEALALSAITRDLRRYVPTAFLSPWKLGLEGPVNGKAVEATAGFPNGIPYRFLPGSREEGGWRVRMNPAWVPYLIDNIEVLRGYGYWRLAEFLQARNPSVPGITLKLFHTEGDRSLAPQRKLWGRYLSAMSAGGKPVRCIYDPSVAIDPDDYALDHFLPWKFVAHNQLWNLTPATPGLNSSKSDQIPEVEAFIPRLVSQQAGFLRFCHAEKSGWTTILDDYATQGLLERDILSDGAARKLERMYDEIYPPMEQIALSMHFERWDFP